MEFIEKNDSNELLKVIDVNHNIEGAFYNAVEFIEREQLLDEALWKKFVDQFREQPDAQTLAWRGEYWGKMMRGAASVYSYTRNPKLYAVLESTVKDMLTVAEADGRVSTYEREKEFQGWDLWCRKYVLLGMLYFYDICHSEKLKNEILVYLIKHTDYIIDRIGEGKLDITSCSSSWFGINSSSLLEPVVWLYRQTRELRFLNFADYIVKCGGADRVNVFELAYENKLLPYQYGISKAYELTSCFEGLIAYYQVTGIEKYKTAAVNYGYAILASDVSIIGSLGCTHELLDHTSVRQTAQRGEREQETCVTVTWMKYCASLYRLTGDPKFADAIEISFYNAYLGALNTEHSESGWMRYKFRNNPILNILKDTFMPFDSYSPLTPGVRGIGVGGNQVLSDGSYYGCCACIGSVGLGIYASHRLLRYDGGIILSFFENGSSEVNINGGRVVVDVQGDYPKHGNIKITVSTEKPQAFEFKVRVPAWSVNAVINSEMKQYLEDGFAVFYGEWYGKTEICISFDMQLCIHYPQSWDEDVIYTDMTGSGKGWHFANAQTVYHKPEYDDYIALTRGPIVLAADSRLGKSADSVFNFEKKNGSLVFTEEEFNECILCLRFCGEGSEHFRLIDYASAGKDWKSTIAAWLPTK
ncbi:MAG: glycoside hydrolase family 127 protein [Clostridia bacterium]|nr:glycoside hydrolase family 127 protein [Clostridia bacterium]